MPSFDDALGCIQDLADVLSQSKDALGVESVSEMHSQIASACSQKLQVARKQHAVVAKEVELLEKEVAQAKTKIEDEKAFSTMLGVMVVELESEKETLQSLTKQLNNTKNKLDETVKQCHVKGQELKSVLERIPSEYDDCKATFDLMHTITKTSFHFDDSNIYIRGCVVNTKPADVQSFSYDSTRVSHYDIVNGIWSNVNALRV